jgi:hypothetical protein
VQSEQQAPKIIRLVVRRPNESKQYYSYEAESAAEAQEIVDEVRKEMKLGGDMMAWGQK